MQESQWKQYQALEAIPDSVANPCQGSFPFSRPFVLVWRSLLNRIARGWDDPKQVEHLENCLNLAENGHNTPLNLHNWHLPSYSGGLFLTSEPNIWYTTDAQGERHWHIYDPRTGKINHPDTEDDVRIWLESHFDA